MDKSVAEAIKKLIDENFVTRLDKLDTQGNTTEQNYIVVRKDAADKQIAANVDAFIFKTGLDRLIKTGYDEQVYYPDRFQAADILMTLGGKTYKDGATKKPYVVRFNGRELEDSGGELYSYAYKQAMISDKEATEYARQKVKNFKDQNKRPTQEQMDLATLTAMLQNPHE
ncbi:MAG: hypothetical protein FWC61_03370 [Proteobacteria bacterium]|nr:hypothetical protein [Pseudomonadota bacterium]